MNQISPCKTKASYKITHCLEPYNIQLYTFWVVRMLLYNHLLSVSLTGWLEILGVFFIDDPPAKNMVTTTYTLSEIYQSA